VSIRAAVDRVWDQIEQQQRKRVVAFLLPTPEGELPSAVDRISDAQIAVVMSMDKQARRDVVQVLKKDATPRVTPELVVRHGSRPPARRPRLRSSGRAVRARRGSSWPPGRSMPVSTLPLAIHCRPGSSQR
jgi:hypothetical protein